MILVAVCPVCRRPSANQHYLIHGWCGVCNDRTLPDLTADPIPCLVTARHGPHPWVPSIEDPVTHVTYGVMVVACLGKAHVTQGDTEGPTG